MYTVPLRLLALALRMGGGVSGCKGKGKVSSAQRERRLQLKRAWEEVERRDGPVIG